MNPLCCWDDFPHKKRCFINSYFYLGFKPGGSCGGDFSEFLTVYRVIWGVSALNCNFCY